VLDNAVLLASRELLDEVESRLARPKFAKYLDEELRHRFVADLARVSIIVQIHGAIRACRDPDDDKLLEIAVAGGADCIVTGDQDLLVLNPFQGTPLLTPAEFLDAVGHAGC
jgi:uncharacterized protein